MYVLSDASHPRIARTAQRSNLIAQQVLLAPYFSQPLCQKNQNGKPTVSAINNKANG